MTATPHYTQFIDGSWVDTDRTFDIIDPANGELVATAARGSVEICSLPRA